MTIDREEARTNPKYAADAVRKLLDGRSQPFITTGAGPGIRPYIKIECDDLALAHAFNDFIAACVRSHEL